MSKILTTKELSEYLRLQQVTICKYAEDGKIPAIRIGSVWRFDKEVIDKWISESGKAPKKATVKRRKPVQSRSKKSKKGEKR
jgi:PTS system nitrogen regulatory IIA component